MYTRLSQFIHINSTQSTTDDSTRVMYESNDISTEFLDTQMMVN